MYFSAKPEPSSLTFAWRRNKMFIFEIRKIVFGLKVINHMLQMISKTTNSRQFLFTTTQSPTTKDLCQVWRWMRSVGLENSGIFLWFSNYTRSINISGQRACLMLCEHLMPHLLWVWLKASINTKHILIHDHPFKVSLLKAQWALSCP